MTLMKSPLYLQDYEKTLCSPSIVLCVSLKQVLKQNAAPKSVDVATTVSAIMARRSHAKSAKSRWSIPFIERFNIDEFIRPLGKVEKSKKSMAWHCVLFAPFERRERQNSEVARKKQKIKIQNRKMERVNRKNNKNLPRSQKKNLLQRKSRQKYLLKIQQKSRTKTRLPQTR